MIELTPHDASVLSRLVQFHRLPIDRRRALLSEIVSADARQVGEAVLDSGKLPEFPERVRETAKRYRDWQQNNERLGKARRKARRVR